jgi:16S rRNA (guanine966-N2)-methyltransferase
MRIIAGTCKGRSLKTTTGPGFRPAMGKVREALFSMLEARGVDWPAVGVIDLFAGSGSLGFEAMSRGAAHVTFVESAPYAAKVIAANAEHLGFGPDRFDIRPDAVAKVLAARSGRIYDVAFIDPPYELRVLGPVLRALVNNGWLAPGALVNAEVETRAPFSPEGAHPELSLEADRAYGQTRVILWRLA